MAVQDDFLKSIAYFSGLSAAELESLKRFIFEKTVERGGIIFFEGEPAQALYFVASGVVKVFKTSADGKEQILQLIRPGESFNDVPVFGDGVNLCGAEAMGPVAFYGIKKVDLGVILHDYPQVAINALEVLSAKAQHLVGLVEDLSFKNVAGRVAKILLEYAGDGPSPSPRLTQQELAALAGTAREMVGRSLKALEGEKAIRLEHRRIVITNKETLKELAGLTS